VTYLLAALLALAAGWCWGHSTARIRYIPVGATRAEDDAALALTDACCEVWWTSAGTKHDTTTCTRKDHTL
jgi:hypothetical protein